MYISFLESGESHAWIVAHTRLLLIGVCRDQQSWRGGEGGGGGPSWSWAIRERISCQRYYGASGSGQQREPVPIILSPIT